MTSRGQDPHPPKKKHATKPRPASVTPLSDDDRALKAAAEFQKAIRHLDEAERLARWGEAPNACTHSAYYAMYHCASAAILAAGGVGKREDVPRSHEHVLEHFGKLVAGEAGDLGQCGLMLGRARTDRMVADYDLVQDTTAADASQSSAEARRLIEACRSKWGFLAPKARP